MPRFTAHLGPLHDELVRLAKSDLSPAEVTRRLGDRANALGLPRPSYARVRALVVVERDRYVEPSWGQILVDVDLRVRPPDAIVQKLAGDLPVAEDAGLRGERRRR